MDNNQGEGTPSLLPLALVHSPDTSAPLPRLPLAWESCCAHGLPSAVTKATRDGQDCRLVPSPLATTRVWEEPGGRRRSGPGVWLLDGPQLLWRAAHSWGGWVGAGVLSTCLMGPHRLQGRACPGPDWKMRLTSWPTSWPGRSQGTPCSRLSPSRKLDSGRWSRVRPSPFPLLPPAPPRRGPDPWPVLVF